MEVVELTNMLLFYYIGICDEVVDNFKRYI